MGKRAKCPLKLDPRARAATPAVPHRREGAIFRLGELRAHAPALKRLCAERSDRRRLYAEVRRGEPLQDKHTGAAQLELDCEQEPDRSGAYNHDIDLLVHESCLHRLLRIAWLRAGA